MDSSTGRWSNEVQQIRIRGTSHAATGWAAQFHRVCSVLPTALEEKLATTDTADDHLSAAMLYLNKAKELETEAVEHETAVSKHGRSGDSKDFHYAALRMAAQQKRSDAKLMRALYATHLEQAQTLHGKAQPQ